MANSWSNLDHLDTSHDRWCWLLGLSSLVFWHWSSWHHFLFRFHDTDVIWEGLLGPCFSSGVPWKHDLDFDAKYTLSEVDMSDSSVHIVIGWFSTVDHQAINKLHGLGTLTTQFSRYNDLTTLSTTLHDEPKHTITGPVKIKLTLVKGSSLFSMGSTT